MLEWNDSYAIGEDSIDGRQRYIFQVINELGEKIDRNEGLEDLDEVLNMLSDYTHLHYEFEERCIYAFECPVVDTIKGEHEKFMDALLKFEKRLKYEGANVLLLTQVHHSAESWITNHIIRIDANLKPCILKMPKDDSDKIEMLKWDYSYTTGEQDVDAQHKLLFSVINELGVKINRGRGIDDLERVLKLLISYTKIHFKHEENCMVLYECPVAGKNKAEHVDFLSAVERFNRELQNVGASDELLKNVHTVVSRWIKSHIMRVDKHLAPCIRRRRTESTLKP